MTAALVPDIQANAEVVAWVTGQCSEPGAIERAEASATEIVVTDPFFGSAAWKDFKDAVSAAYGSQDFVVVRGFPAIGDGAPLMYATLALSSSFRTYRGRRVVKHFRMSPWTEDLSHTTREGHFHSDLNTAETPPAITAMQCLRPDPGGQEYGVSRVARLADLLRALQSAGDNEALSFLCDTEVDMASGLANGVWRGRIVAGNSIRFHPETIRSAMREKGENLASVEAILERIQSAALSASPRIYLETGAILIVSNTRTLHYRGACTVKFKKFPRDFDSREIYILHALAI